MIWTIPNILTVFRLLAAPLLIVAYVALPSPAADWVALGLFVGAALTDWIDGYLARKLDQTSRFGAMIDPIADKAMVVSALVLISAQRGLDPLILIPAAFILFREVFVSGLREFLGADSGKLAVTKLAKWKTTAQMVAIAVLLTVGLFEHSFGMLSFGLGPEMTRAVLNGSEPDVIGLNWRFAGLQWSSWGGMILLWIAALLTVITGFDYFRKSLPFLKEPA